MDLERGLRCLNADGLREGLGPRRDSGRGSTSSYIHRVGNEVRLGMSSRDESTVLFNNVLAAAARTTCIKYSQFCLYLTSRRLAVSLSLSAVGGGPVLGPAAFGPPHAGYRFIL